MSNNKNIKINIDDLYERRNQISDMKILQYSKILNRAHSKIKQTSKLRSQDTFCFYLVPEFLIGVPSYDTASCIAYVIDNLKENGFYVKYTHPNLLFISWKHYIDKRGRLEFKRNNGYSIDGFGNPLANKEKNDNNPNNFILKDKNNVIVKKNQNDKYKKISSYNPTGNFIYSNDLFKKIEDNAKH